MNQNQFRKRLGRVRQEPFIVHNLDVIPSRTDPTLALSGKHLFVCGMKGIPIPEPPMLQFTNVKASEVGVMERLHMDKFERLQKAQKELKSIDKKIVDMHAQLPKDPNN